MKMTKSNKGQMRVIETILASFIIVVAFVFANNMAVSPPSSRYETSDLEKLGYNILHNLDEHGLLTFFVYDPDITSGQSYLESALRVSLSRDVYFNLTIYSIDESGQLRKEGEHIVYCESEAFGSDGSTASVTYVLTGTGVEYDLRILILMLVRR